MSEKENLDQKQKPEERKMALIKEYQRDWLEETGRNFSLFVRQKIKEQMAREGFDPHTGKPDNEEENEK